MSEVERIARLICKAWLKPDPKLEPAFTDQRWPLFREEATAVIASVPPNVDSTTGSTSNTDETK